MQRANYLIEPIAEMDNLYLAYYKAQKGKGAKQSVFDYGRNLKAHLELLQSQILRGAIDIGDYLISRFMTPKSALFVRHLSLKGCCTML